MGEQLYRFRWSNIDLHDFIEQRKLAAQNLRLDAKILIVRAEQLEIEMREWQAALEIPDDE